jgi:predicted DNA-binding transcriptional regulator AlpA
MIEIQHPPISGPAHVPGLPAEQPLLDEAGLCAWLSISPKTAQAWRAQRRGPPYVKLCRSVRYRPADIRAWLAQGGIR